MSYTKSKDLIDPQSLGNWILVDDRTINNAVIDYTLSNLDGDVDPRWMFDVEVKSNVSGAVWAQPNAVSTGTAYMYTLHYAGGGSSHYISQVQNGYGLLLAEANPGCNSTSQGIFNSNVSSLAYRQSSHTVNTNKTGWSGVCNVANIFTDQSTKITSYRIHSAGVTAIYARIKVYKWTDFKPINLATQELVKEYNLSNQTLNDTISWDGDVDDQVIIETNLGSMPNPATIVIQPNGDSIAANYVRSWIYQDGSSIVSGSDSTVAGFQVGYMNSVADYLLRTNINLKSGTFRKSNSISVGYISNNTDSLLSNQASYWKNSATKVTSLTITSQTVAVTGTVRIYKLAKAHLLNSTPNFIQGLNVSLTDTNTVKVNTGEVEINGVIHYLSSSKSVTLSGNLRSGESEAPSTQYYLYAVKSSSRIPDFKFSASAPSIDRYSNTVTLDTVNTVPGGYYHPIQGLDWRYVGKAYNNASSNLTSANSLVGLTVDGIGSVSDNTARDAISNPIDGQLVKTLSDHQLNMYRSDTGQWQKNIATPMDSQSFGNWILVDQKTVTSAVIDWDVTNVDGDQDPQWKFEIEHYGQASANSAIVIRPNNDSGANYTNIRNFGNGTTTYSDSQGTTGLTVGFLANNVSYHATTSVVIGTKVQGKRRQCVTLMSLSDTTTPSNYIQTIAGSWSNASSKITSFKILSTNSATVPYASIKVYKWQDMKPVTLHSYELVKEYNLTSQSVNDVISYDGDVDDRLIVETNLISGSAAGGILLCINGDNTAANYVRGGTQQDGSATVSFSDSSFSGMLMGYCDTNFSRFTICDINLKSGVFRKCITRAASYNSANLDYVGYSESYYWKNSATKVSSLTFTSSGVLLTGTVRVYKLAKTHLLSSDPGLLRGMWQKSIDDNTVQVQSGSIEIAGVNHYVGSPINVTLSGNLRTGESEAPSTYFYLYAIKSSSRIPTFKFSTSQPTLNRFGSSVVFADVEPEEDLYHPTEGITWRYIGQVYNNSSSNILGFDKCRPGYWESSATAIPGTGTRTINHGLGKVPRESNFLMRFSTSGSYVPSNSTYDNSGSGEFGVLNIHGGYPTNMSFSTYFSVNGIYYDGAAWRTTGYYKLIVK